MIGLSVRIIAIKTLKKRFSFQLNTQDQIIQTGIYKYIRHPSYIGTLTMILGLCFVHLICAVMYISLLFFLARAINEEQILRYNPQYKEYMQKTGMFLPKLKKQKG